MAREKMFVNEGEYGIVVDEFSGRIGYYDDDEYEGDEHDGCYVYFDELMLGPVEVLDLLQLRPATKAEKKKYHEVHKHHRYNLSC